MVEVAVVVGMLLVVTLELMPMMSMIPTMPLIVHQARLLVSMMAGPSQPQPQSQPQSQPQAQAWRRQRRCHHLGFGQRLHLVHRRISGA